MREHLGRRAAGTATEIGSCSARSARCVRRALSALFGGAVGKDTVSRAWHKVRSDWEAWQKVSVW